MGEFRGLVPDQLREIDFYGDMLVVALVRDEAYVALKPITDYLGLDWSAQRQRLQRDEVLLRHSSSVVMIGADCRRREMVCLQLEYLPGWLFSIAPGRIKPELAPKLLRYREDCFRALWHTFSICWGLNDLVLEDDIVFSNEDDSVSEGASYLTGEQIIQAVRHQRMRAEREDLPATLTVEQWLFVLDFFAGKCAYCRKRPGLLIEHFIPISLGGGTTVGNCVPSCYPCNSKKGNSHPDEVTRIPCDVLNDIRSWFARFADLVV